MLVLMCLQLWKHWSHNIEIDSSLTVKLVLTLLSLLAAFFLHKLDDTFHEFRNKVLSTLGASYILGR